MEQLDLLWEYQEFDLILDQYAQERKNHKLRHTLLKLKKYLINRQAYLEKLDEEANKKSSYFDRINHEYENILGVLKTEQEKIAAGEYTTLKQIEELEKEAAAMRDRAIKREDELKRLIRELDNFQRKLENLGHQIAKAKKEYADTKVAYDKEVEKIQQEYNKVKVQRDQVGARIGKALMTKYKNIRTSRVPVISTIVEDRCGGCNMSLASLVIQNVKDKKRIVECENCGRILYDGA